MQIWFTVFTWYFDNKFSSIYDPIEYISIDTARKKNKDEALS